MRSHLRRIPTLVLLGGVLSACSVELAGTEPGKPLIANECATDADCGSAGVCGPGICVTTVGDLDFVMLEILPPASAPYGAGDSFVLPLEGVSQITPISWNREVVLPDYSEVLGRLSVPDSAVTQLEEASKWDKCAPYFHEGSLGVHMELTRAEQSIGIPSTTFSTNAELTDTGWVAKATIPSGLYRIYLTPLGECEGNFPRILFSETLNPGTVGLDIPIPDDPQSSPPFLTLSGEISANTREEGSLIDLTDWTVSLVEPDRGRFISSVDAVGGTVGRPYNGDPLQSNFGTLFFLRDDNALNALVKLAPPEDLAAPTLLWDLAALDLNGTGRVGIDLSNLELTKVIVHGRVLEAGSNTTVSGATVKLRSIELEGTSQGLTAMYATTVESADEGVFTVELLPGSYRAVVIPPDGSELAVTEATKWEVGYSAEQFGRTVEIQPMASVAGTVLDSVRDLSFEEVDVIATPASNAPFSFQERALGLKPMVPREATTVTRSGGSFTLAVDPGSYDLAAQPATESGFPWSVRARVKVTEEGLGLGTMEVGFPVPLGGTITDPLLRPVQRANVRAYVLLDSSAPNKLAPPSSTSIEGALQVAEGRSDESGNFTLWLPSTIE